MVYVWSINTHTNELTIRHQLDGHNYGVAYLTWSPDSKHIIACGPDDCSDLWLWNITVSENNVLMLLVMGKGVFSCL